MRVPLKYNFRNILARKTTFVLTASGISLAVLIFVALSSLVQGMRAAVSNTGLPDNVVILSQGAVSIPTSLLEQSVIQEIKYQPEIAREAGGVPLVSEELMVEDKIYLQKLGQSLSAPIRGVGPLAMRVHAEVQIIAGSALGANGTVILGKKIAEQIGAEAVVGNPLRIGPRNWTIAGIFSAGGSALESEVWAGLTDLTAATRKKKISLIVAKVTKPELAGKLSQRLNNTARLGVKSAPEPEYFKSQTEDAQQMWLMTIVVSSILGLAAAFGGMNTMYAAIANRTYEIGVLKALGFSRFGILSSFLVECLIVALCGGILGCAAVFLLNDLPVRTLMNGQLIDIRFHLTLAVFLQGLFFSLFIGITGGLFPSLKASKMEAIDSIRAR
ncbi:MAG: ABC transporter permease [Chloracidobacterium sp.]|nr:ABC transporter permease [Chloracidobacterium sp.]